MSTPTIHRGIRLETSYWPADTSSPLLDWTLGQALREAAAIVPDRLALIEGIADSAARRRWTYAGLLADSERVAAALLARFAPGERVAVWAANVPEWELLLYGCALADVVMVTVNPAYRQREFEYVLDKSGAAGLFVMDGYRGFDMQDAVRRARPRLSLLREVHRIADIAEFLTTATTATDLPAVGPADPCMIMFTSGTTGAQKGVVFHHKGALNMALFTQERGGLAPGGVFINPMPMFHIGALGHAAIGTVMRHATHVLASEWDPVLFMSLVAQERGTYSLLVPTMIEGILRHPDRSNHDLGTLKNLVSGAAMVEADLIRRTRAELGCTLCNIYGQTEMQGVVTAVRRDDTMADQAETIGQPLPQVEVRISDPATGDVVPLGTQGEICVRGYQTMVGYFGMPEETAKTVAPDGWLRSGDLGSMDERGYLKITGRLKDMIIRGGENIYPREVEMLLMEHPEVADVVVLGIPDSYWGEQVGAVIIPKSHVDGPSPTELQEYCRAQLASYKMPRLWYRVDEFPRTETGKVQKFKLLNVIRSGELKPMATS